jgi:hypothetical protein
VLYVPPSDDLSHVGWEENVVEIMLVAKEPRPIQFKANAMRRGTDYLASECLSNQFT